MDLLVGAEPLVRSGGVFLVCIGAALVAGGLWPRRVWMLLGTGATVGAIAMIPVAFADVARFGPPTRVQVIGLVVAVVLEIVAIAWVNARLRARGERTLMLATLLVVAVHFLPMIPAFGLLIGVLAVLGVLNAIAGLTLALRMPWRFFWVVDGALKLGIGALMVRGA